MKDQFPIFQAHPDLIYLDTAATAHKPKCVIDAISHFYANDYATVHRSIYRSSSFATGKYNETREAARKFLNAKKSEEIVFTRGTTDSLNLVAASYGRAFLAPGDEILVSTVEHHSNLVPWQMVAKQTGAILKFISIDVDGVLLWKGTIGPKTKIIALAHVSNITGTIHPIAEIAKAAPHAIIVVDGAQAAPHMAVDVQALSCHFYAFSGHKCYGPTGIGVLYGKKELLEKMDPIHGGSDMIEHVDLDAASFADTPLRFEAGTPHIAGVIGLKSSLDFIEKIGRNTLSAHEDALLKRASANLLSIPNLRILGTAPKKGPILTFDIEGIHPLDLATLLDLKNIAVRSGHLCSQPAMRIFGIEAASRASFGIYNTMEEVDQFCSVLENVIKQLGSGKKI